VSKQLPREVSRSARRVSRWSRAAHSPPADEPTERAPAPAQGRRVRAPPPPSVRRRLLRARLVSCVARLLRLQLPTAVWGLLDQLLRTHAPQPFLSGRRACADDLRQRSRAETWTLAHCGESFRSAVRAWAGLSWCLAVSGFEAAGRGMGATLGDATGTGGRRSRPLGFASHRTTSSSPAGGHARIVPMASCNVTSSCRFIAPERPGLQRPRPDEARRECRSGPFPDHASTCPCEAR
jgi:hypothetical protein